MTNKEQTAALLSELQVRLEQLIGHIEFGSVELVFHHGKLVQLEKHEKLRLESQLTK